MAYKNIRGLIKELGCDELQVEHNKIYKRRDIKLDKEIIRRIRELGIISEIHFEKEVCLDCGLHFRDCPIKK